MFRSAALCMGMVLLLAAAPVGADDLTGTGRFVCAANSVIVCYDDGGCETGSPMELKVPQFIEVDLQQKRLSTTKASGESRVTPIVNLQRDAGHIVLQGYEKGRAFSFIISEKTGMASVAVAADGRSVAVFGACTPTDSSR